MLIKIKMEKTHPAIRLRGDVVTTSLCTSQRRHMYAPNKTLNDVLLERRQDVSMVRLQYVLLERCDDVLKGRNNDVPSVHLHDNSRKSQMKHPTTSQWYVTKTSQDVPLLRLYEVSCKSQMKHLTTLLWYVSTTSGSYVVATDSTFSSYFVMSSIW